MKLEPMKSYKQMQYPTLEEIQNEKELLTKPLNKWKKMGITCVMLMTLLGTNLQAAEKGEGINDKILLSSSFSKDQVEIMRRDLIDLDNSIMGAIETASPPTIHFARRELLLQEITGDRCFSFREMIELENLLEIKELKNFINWLFMQGVL